MWEGQKIRVGCISIGDFTEEFTSFLDFWTPADYETQWRAEIGRMVSGARVDALITDMHNLGTAHHLVSWPLYREDDLVFVQNRLLFLSDLGRPLHLDQLIGKLGDRSTISEDGATISEWSVGIQDLRDFLARLA